MRINTIHTQRRSVYSSANSQNKHETARNLDADLRKLIDTSKSREKINSTHTRNEKMLNVIGSHKTSSKISARDKSNNSDLNDILTPEELDNVKTTIEPLELMQGEEFTF